MLKFRMKEKISPLAVFWFFGALASVLLIVLFGTVGLEEVILSDSVSAATSSAVTVSAAVTVVLSCESSPGSTAFGTLSSTATTTASPNASTTMACANAASGCTLYVKDTGDTASSGLATDTPAYLIPSPNAANSASTTLSANVEGYGIQATSTGTTGSGNSLPIEARYAVLDGDVGGLVVSSETQALATANSTTTGREVLITHLAVISDITPGGNYEDTITYSCLAN